MTLLDEVRRFLAEDTRRRVTDPKPLYATAGAVDVTIGYLRAVPQKLESAADRARVEWTPERFGDAFTDLVDEARDSADDAVRRLQEQRSRITSPADLATSARDVTDQVLGEARKAPGRVAVSVAETAGAVFETYDDLADRGKTVLARLRGDAAPGETATSGRPAHPAPVFRRPTSPTAPPPPAGPPGDPAAGTSPAGPPKPPTGPPTFTRPTPAPASAPVPAPAAGPAAAPVGHDVSVPPPTPAEHPTPADLPPANAAVATGKATATTPGRTPSARTTPAKRAAPRKTAPPAPAPAEPSVQGNAVTTRKGTSRSSAPVGDGTSGVGPPANAVRRSPRKPRPAPDEGSEPPG